MCRLLHNALLFLLAVLPTGVLAQGGIDFHPIAGQTYVIMNAETGEFLYRGPGDGLFNLNRDYYPFMTNTKDKGESLSDLIDYSALLWGIEPSASMNFSYYICNKQGGKKYFLTLTQYPAGLTTYYDYLLEETDSTNNTVNPFYFIRSEYNREGYKVSTEPNLSSNLWYCTHSIKGKHGYYLYNTNSDKLSMTKASGISDSDPKYDLGSFCFFTYDDLWNKYIKIKNDTVNGHCLAGGGYTPIC